MIRIPRPLARLVSFAAIAALIGCGDDEPPPTSFVPPNPILDIVVTGDEQEAVAGSELPEIITLQAVGREQMPLSGARFTLFPLDDGLIARAGGGGASGFGSSYSTDADANGEVDITWRLTTVAGFTAFRTIGFLPGEADTIEVFVTATALPGPLANVVQEGNNQGATAGTQLARPLAVVLLDAFENPIPDVDVTWAVVSGGGAVNLTDTTTDDSGRATTGWTLGTTAGDQRVSATIGTGGGTVIFTALAL